MNSPVMRRLSYFSENAKTFEEVRIAVAGLEALNKSSPADFDRWLITPNVHLRGCRPRDVANAGDTAAVEQAASRLRFTARTDCSLATAFAA